MISLLVTHLILIPYFPLGVISFLLRVGEYISNDRLMIYVTDINDFTLRDKDLPVLPEDKHGIDAYFNS